MSTTSCPRCSAQVTLPVGVPNETTVRCPLCHAHYTLADALINMPPLLEVVEESGEALPADWYDAPPGDEAGKPLAAAALPNDDSSEADTLELGDLELGESLDLDEGDDSAGRETLDDALTVPTLGARAEPVAEEDTLLSFEAPEADEPAEPSSSFDEDGLDGGGSLSGEEAGAETLEFGSDRSESFSESNENELQFNLDAAEVPGEDMTLEFGEPVAEEAGNFGGEPDFGGDEVKFDLEDEAGEQAETIQFAAPLDGADDQTVEFNFDAEEPAGAEDGLREFEDNRVEASGGADDIPLDLPGAPAVTAVSPVEDASASGKKGKKEKKKKEKKAKVVLADGETPKRSLVGSLVSVLLPAVIAIPLALYGALWISKDYDFLGLGNYLPSAVLPAEYSKKPTQLAQYTPPATPAPVAPETPAKETAPEETAPDETPAAGEATEHVAGRPTDEAAKAPAAEEKPAEELPAEAPAGEAPSLTPANDSATTEPVDPFAPAPSDPADAPGEEMPAAEKPADASDDLFAPADAPAEAMPEQPADAPAPAEADPFAPEPAEKPAEMPAEADPFAPAPEEKPADAPAEADPFAPEPAEKPAEMPAEADPFAPAPVEKPAAAPLDAPVATPAEPDPFAPAPEETPAEMPADKPADDDPFAPAPALPEATPAPAPDARPAEPDPFAPAEPLPEPTAPEPAAPAAEEPGAPHEALGPRNVPAVSPDDVSGAMQATLVAGQQLMAAEVSGSEPQLRKARAAFYVNLFGMADAITSAQLSEGAAQIDPQLAALGPTLKQQLAADPKRLEALKVFGARWIGFPKRTTNGVVVSGTVESAEQVGKLFHTKARLGNADAPLITIVTAQQPEVAAGDTVLALGSIVDDPTRRISGYEGSDPSVVWSGLTMKVAPAGN